jgi:hypothetical protein
LPGERRTPEGREVTTANSSSAVTFRGGSAVPKRSRNTVRLAYRSAFRNFRVNSVARFVHTQISPSSHSKSSDRWSRLTRLRVALDSNLRREMILDASRR